MTSTGFWVVFVLAFPFILLGVMLALGAGIESLGGRDWRDSGGGS